MGFSYMKQGSLSPGDLDALVSALQLAQELPFLFVLMKSLIVFRNQMKHKMYLLITKCTLGRFQH